MGYVSKLSGAAAKKAFKTVQKKWNGNCPTGKNGNHSIVSYKSKGGHHVFYCRNEDCGRVTGTTAF